MVKDWILLMEIILKQQFFLQHPSWGRHWIKIYLTYHHSPSRSDAQQEYTSKYPFFSSQFW